MFRGRNRMRMVPSLSGKTSQCRKISIENRWISRRKQRRSFGRNEFCRVCSLAVSVRSKRWRHTTTRRDAVGTGIHITNRWFWAIISVQRPELIPAKIPPPKIRRLIEIKTLSSLKTFFYCPRRPFGGSESRIQMVWSGLVFRR